ncbi:MAG: SCO family protein [Dehalococcoidia bacterium]
MADLRGQSVVVTFLYTACRTSAPDGGEVATDVEALGKDAGKVAIIGISVDPDRDVGGSRSSTARHLAAGDGLALPRWRRGGAGGVDTASVTIPPQPAAGRGAETLRHTEVLSCY